MNDKQATPGREPGFYWVKFYGEWEVMKLDSKWGWQHEGEDILEETLEEIGERIERQTPDGGWVDLAKAIELLEKRRKEIPGLGGILFLLKNFAQYHSGVMDIARRVLEAEKAIDAPLPNE